MITRSAFGIESNYNKLLFLHHHSFFNKLLSLTSLISPYQSIYLPYSLSSYIFSCLSLSISLIVFFQGTQVVPVSINPIIRGEGMDTGKSIIIFSSMLHAGIIYHTATLYFSLWLNLFLFISPPASVCASFYLFLFTFNFFTRLFAHYLSLHLFCHLPLSSYLCHSLSPFISLSPTLYVSLSHSICRSLSHSIFLSVSLSYYICLSVSLLLTISPFIPQSSFFICLSLSLSFSPSVLLLFYSLFFSQI